MGNVSCKRHCSNLKGNMEILIVLVVGLTFMYLLQKRNIKDQQKIIDLYKQDNKRLEEYNLFLKGETDKCLDLAKKALEAEKDILDKHRKNLDLLLVQINLIEKIGETTSELKILNLVTNYYCTPIEEQAKKLDN